MNNEEIAGNISGRMHQIIALPAQLSRVEMLRELCGDVQARINDHNQNILSIAKQKALLKTDLQEVSKDLLAAVLELDQTLSILYRPIDAPSAIIQEVARKAHSKKTTEAGDEAAQTETEAEGGKTGETEAVPAGAPEPAKHPCHLCDDVYYDQLNLVKHIRSAHKLGLQESLDAANGNSPASARSICADCLGDCEMDGTPRDPSPTMTACTGHSNEPNEDQILWRNTTCQEWRTCPFTAECFGPSNEENPDCFKETEIRKRGLASLEAETGRPAASESAELAVCSNTKCNAFDTKQHDNCYACGDLEKTSGVRRSVTTCKDYLNSDDALAAARAKRMEFIEKQKGKAVPEGKVVDASFLSDEEVFAKHEPAEAILPRGEFRAEDLPKGKKKRADLLEARREDVAKLVARRIDMLKRGSAAVSDRDKVMGYDLDYNLTLNKTQLSYALSQFNGLDEFLNPSTPAPVKEEPKQEVIQAVDESPAQASEVVQCRNNECASFDGLCADNCSKLPIGEPEPVTACKGYKAEWPDEQAETVGLLDQDTAHVGNAIEQLESELQPATFNPLDEPLGDCEQCMGYGVVEGDLFGESTFIPCRCEAGIKVAGDKWAGPVTDGGTNPKYRKCCDECSIDDPDCSSCQLPDLEVSAQAEKPVPVIDKDRTCCMPLDRDWKEDNGNRVLFCRVCNLIHRLTDMDGKDLPFEIGTKYNLQPKTVAPEPAKPALTPLQLKCTHPSVFRTPVDGGFYCKCCKQTILSGGGQPGLSAVQPGAPR